MKKLLLTLGVVAVLLLAVILAGALYISGFDANEHKPAIAKAFQAATGRELALDGNIALTFYPWLGLSVDKFSISNAPGFNQQPLLSVAHAEFRMKLLPILHDEYVIDTVKVAGVRANLEIDAAGHNNWTLNTGSTGNKASGTAGGSMKLEKLVLGGVDISDTRLSYDDRHANTHYEISDVGMQIGALTYDKPLGITAGLKASSRQPKLDAVIKLTGTALYDADNGLYQLDPLQLAATVTGPSLPKGSSEVLLESRLKMDTGKDVLQVPELQLTAFGAHMNGNLDVQHMSGTPHITGKIAVPQFNARQLLQQLDLPVPVTADPTVLQKVAVNADIDGTTGNLALKQVALLLDDTHIKADVGLKDTTTFSIDVDAINADRYLAPKTSATADKSASSENKPLPVDMLRSLELQGTVNIGQLTISGLKLAAIKVPLQASRGVIALKGIAASLYDGSFSGDLGLDASGNEPLANVNTTLSKIDLGPLMKDFMNSSQVAGKANIELALTGNGKDSVALKHNLNGSGKLHLDDGVLHGVDIGATLTTIETIIRSKKLVDLPSGGDTRFNSFAATLAIKDGVVSSNDLLIRAPGWQVKGNGTLADLRRDAIDFALVASVDPATATVANQKYDIGGHELPIACSGSLSGPRCLPDAKAIFKATVGDAVKQKLGDFLKNRLLK